MPPEVIWLSAIATVILGIGNIILLWWNVRRAGNYTLLVGQLSRETKISEFRHSWIIALRDDIAAFMGAAELWMRQYDFVNSKKQMGEEDHDLLRREEKVLDDLANKALQLYWRIQLRINPLDTSKTKARDDAFLQSMIDLLDPSKQTDHNFHSDWRKNADKAVKLGRQLLKEEWDVTKKGDDSLKEKIAELKSV